MKSLSVEQFDYSELDKDTKGMLISYAGEFSRAMRDHKQTWLTAGEPISKAHELLATSGKEGKFSKWVEVVLGVSRQTAYRFMWTWERFGNCNSLEQFTTEALYLLAGPNVPDKAVKEAVKLADKGQRIDKPLGEELIEKHTVEAEPKPSRSAKLPSQSDEPPTPAEDETALADDMEAVSGEETAVKQYGDTFDPPTFANGKCDLAAKQAPYDDMLNAITSITKHWNAVTGDERDGVYAVDKKNRVEQLLRDLRPPIAQARPHALCDHCEGKGCKKCQNCGWWPRSVVEGLKK
jgi:hypothetical protein